jgi:hypothetical protein
LFGYGTKFAKLTLYKFLLHFSILMRALLVIIFTAFSTLVFAQNLAIHWQKSLGGRNNEFAYATTPTSDGGYVIVGSTNNSNDGDVPNSKAFSGAGGSDIWVVKLNNWGEIVWSKTFGGSKDDIATDVLETKDKGILLVATTNSIDGEAAGNGSRGGLILLKLKTDGSIEWRKVFASGYNVGETSFAKADANSKPTIKPTADGGYMLGATITPINTSDFWLSKLNATGNIQWTKIYGSSQNNDYMQEVIVCADGGFLMVGGTEASNLEISGAGKGFIDFYVVKTNATGTVLWQKALGGTNLDIAFSGIETSDNGYIVVGETNSTNGDMTPNLGQKDGVLLKFANNGNLLWKVLAGGDDIDGLYTIKKASDGRIFAMGISSSVIGKVKPKGPVGDMWLVNIENSGIITSHTMFGGADSDIVRGAFPTADGGFIIAGNSESVDGDLTENKGGTDFWSVKIGTPLPVQMKEFSASLTPEQYIKLTWESTAETRSKNFVVERSIDAIKFTSQGQVAAAVSSTTKKSYSFTDQKPIFGNNYYRLKFYDDAGKEFTYKTLTVNVTILATEPQSDNKKVIISSNPVENAQFFVKTTNFFPKNIQLLNLIGQPIPIEIQLLDINQVQISLKNTPESGIYFLLLDSGESKIVEKIIVR